MAQFKFDQRGLEKALQQAVQPALKQKADGANRAMAQFNRQYLGKPVATVKPALKRVWEQHFGKIDDRKLTEYAKLVSEGTEIKFRA